MRQSLPIKAMFLINEYSKPVTRADWQLRPKFTFEQFFYGIQKQNKYILMKVYYEVIMYYCHHYMLIKYREYIKDGYNREMALTKIQTEYGLEPRIMCLMCNIK